MEIQNEMTYDSVFWAGVSNMKEYLVPLVNEAFGEHFTEKADVKLAPGKIANQMPDESFYRGEVDAYAILTEADASNHYHFEVETRGNKGIFIRIAEYTLGKAQSNIEVTDRGIEVTLAQSAVIFLKKAGGMPDAMSIIYKGGSGELVEDVPVIKIKDYSLEDLFGKKLLLLLPFYGFTFDDRFAEMDATGIDDLKAGLDEMNRRLLELLERGEIDAAQHSHLIDWMKRVLDKLTVNYKNVAKGVNDLMTGYILHTRTDDILDQGRNQRDREKIAVMLRKGLTPEQVADYGDYPIELVEEVEREVFVMA